MIQINESYHHQSGEEQKIYQGFDGQTKFKVSPQGKQAAQDFNHWISQGNFYPAMTTTPFKPQIA
jgi:hypothetical protein